MYCLVFRGRGSTVCTLRIRNTIQLTWEDLWILPIHLGLSTYPHYYISRIMEQAIVPMCLVNLIDDVLVPIVLDYCVGI